jgi:hypothetical protein
MFIDSINRTVILVTGIGLFFFFKSLLSVLKKCVDVLKDLGIWKPISRKPQNKTNQK